MKSNRTPTTPVIHTFPLPMPFGLGSVNAYLIRTSKGHFLVDTGSVNNRRRLLAELAGAGCGPDSLKLVILTHGDFDHIGNASRLHANFGAPLAMHPGDAGMAESGDMFINRKKPALLIRTLFTVFSGFGKSERFTPDMLLTDLAELAGLGLDATILALPGHSRGSIGILTAQGDLFCGDLLENTTTPALNTLVDDQAAARASLERICKLKIRMVYPGHGRPFRLDAVVEPAAGQVYNNA